MRTEHLLPHTKPPAEAPSTKLDWPELIETALTMPGDLMGNFSRFHPYSFLNTLLLYRQGASGPVASYARWKALGRQVRRGESGMTIIRPINIKREDQEGNEVHVRRFKPVRGAFQYSQTDGEDIPMPEVPDWSLDRMLGNLAIERKPFTLTDGDIGGYSWDRNIAVNPMSPYPLKTALHETSHILAGHTTPDNLSQYQAHRGTYEFVAEGAAFLATKELGHLSVEAASESRAYLQGWTRGEEVPEQAIRQVFSNTDQMIRSGRVAIEAITE